MRKKLRPYKYRTPTSDDKLHYAGRFSYKCDCNGEFISGIRRAGLERIFADKGKYVITGKSKTKKILIGIGLHELTLRSIKFGKSKSGYDKCDLAFHKAPDVGWFNNSDLVYDMITCTHLLLGKDRKTFNDLWYTSFTANFTKEDFEQIKQGTKYKCVVRHVEEQWTNNGQPILYQQGNNIGKPVIKIRPEIIKVYDIDTPNEEIEFSYFKLYVPVK